MARTPTTARESAGRRTAGLIVVAAIYVIGVGVVVLWPTPVTAHFEALLGRMHGWLPWSDKALEFGANVLMFVPAGLLAGLLLPPRRRWLAVVGGVLVSVLIEFVQGELLPERFASVRDVVANSGGVLVGVVVAIVLRHRRRRRGPEGTRAQHPGDRRG